LSIIRCKFHKLRGRQVSYDNRVMMERTYYVSERKEGYNNVIVVPGKGAVPYVVPSGAGDGQLPHPQLVLGVAAQLIQLGRAEGHGRGTGPYR
jgi:hypothetical protein